MWLYDTAQRTWQQQQVASSSAPCPRAGHRLLATAGNQLAVFGGADSEQCPLNVSKGAAVADAHV